MLSHRVHCRSAWQGRKDTDSVLVTKSWQAVVEGVMGEDTKCLNSKMLFRKVCIQMKSNHETVTVTGDALRTKLGRTSYCTPLHCASQVLCFLQVEGKGLPQPRDSDSLYCHACFIVAGPAVSELCLPA